MRPAPLEHLRVIDLTDVRGALAARLLADLGADVIRVPPPATAAAPLPPSVHAFRNANKRGASIDLETGAGRATFAALCAEADILIENLDAAARERLELSPRALEERQPHLVHVAIADFGLSGPRAAWRLEALPAFAASGALFASGLAERAPCWHPGRVAHDCAAVFAALGALVAVFDRDRQGGGQTVEVSVQEAAMSGLNPWAIPLADYQRVYPMVPSAPARNGDGSYLVLPASDGHVRIVIGNAKHWRGFMAVLGRPEALEGEQWENLVFRMVNSDVIRAIASDATRPRTRADLFEDARRNGVPLAPVHRPSEFVAAEQTRARRFFHRAHVPGGGDAPLAGPPWRLERTPGSIRRPAPSTAPEGQVASGFAPRGESPSWPAGDGAKASTAGCLLDGVRVVELGVAAVVPELCWVLSELGAEVIKIESRAHLDVLRNATLDGQPNRSWTFNDECRGRKSVCLDLGTKRGRELALDLCARADVIAENHRGGVLRQLGLDYDSVRPRNPAVIYFSSQGYGRGGPLGEMQSFGPLNAAFAGVQLLWNHGDAPYPAGTSLAHPDHIAGKMGAVAVLAALDHRRRSGGGQLIDMAQTEAAAYLIGEVYLEATLTGRDPEPQGNRVDHAVPHGVYPCSGEDRWCAIAVGDDAAWSRLVARLGWTAEPELGSLAGRLAARDRIDARLSEWTRARPPEEAAAELQSVGVSAMAVQNGDDHRADPHLAERGAIVTVEHPEVGAERHVGNPIRLSRSRLRTAAAAPLLGADTESVLTELLGLSREEVARLVATGVCR
jgi:crotonobetainyl-CoA:carnitine CoA-transferase CaiB-like acyl-CoA transferase